MALAAVLFTGCSGPASAPSTTTPAAASKAAPPAAPAVAEVAPPPAYTYSPVGRRDPFAPLIEREEKKEQKFALPPLERYAVTEFKLTGVVWGGFGYNALMEGPDGKGYFVRKGTIIGLNHGKIKKISKDSLIVEESFKNYMGEMERKEITVKLQRKQEGLR